MTLGFTGRLARASASRPWLTIVGWVAIIAAATVAAGSIGDALIQEERALVTTETQQAEDLMEELRGTAVYDTSEESIIVTSDTFVFGDASYMDALDEVARLVGAVEGIESVAVPTTDAPFPVSDNGRSAILTAAVADEVSDDFGDVVNETVDGIEIDGFEVYAYGPFSGEATFGQLAEETLIQGELIGIGVAVVILVVVFGALVAAGLPIIVGGVSIVLAVGATAIVGTAFDLSFFVVNMISMMGLALGIDYSLVIVQRFREELAHGRTVKDAVAVAGNTASRAVLISGGTVLVSLTGMVIVPSTIMVSLGFGAMVVAVMAVATALTLLPALLGLLGHRVNKGRVPTAHPGQEPKTWTALARAVMRRPVAGAVAGFAILIALAIPALSMRLTFPGIEALPEDLNFRQAVEVLQDDFGYGHASTVVVIENTAGAEDAVERLATAMGDSIDFGEVEIQWFDDAAIINAKDHWDGASTESQDAIYHLRDVVIPQELDGTGATAYVAGEQADTIDFSTLIMDKVVWVALIVLGASLLLLLTTFRSLTVAVTAIIFNVLSAAAAYGILVMVFQYGWGASLLGMPVVGGIAPWIPLMLFAVLFGLSMDYHVFLVSRIKERHSATGDTNEAIAFGLGHTGALITGAALIMVAVFGGFAIGDLAEFNQMGLGVAVAILLDATVVRSLLVPSVMGLLGDKNWYLPRWLGWLPHLQVEGTAPQYLEPAPVPARVG